MMLLVMLILGGLFSVDIPWGMVAIAMVCDTAIALAGMVLL